MRISRRAALVGGAAAGIGALGVAARHALSARQGDGVPHAVAIAAEPIPVLRRSSPDQRRFGRFAFRSGLVLTSPSRDFGGLSGLWRSPDGAELVSVSDAGHWFTARPAYRDGRLSGLDQARLAPMLGEAGEPLSEGRAYDTESVAIADGVAYVGIERVHEVRRFAWAEDGVRARGVPIPLPAEVKTLPANRSLEALAVAPRGHRLAGAVVAIAEEARSGDDAPTRGWVVTGPERFGFDVVRSRDFNITDAAFLPTGELLLLERHFSVTRWVECRVRRVPADALRPGARLDGEILFEADTSFSIDNMEGLALHRDAGTGETVVTLVSDDNFSPIQRTLLLEFTLAG